MTHPWLAAIADPRCRVELHAGRAELPAEALGPRRVDRHILFLMLAGRYDGEIDGRPARVEAGDLLWIPAGVQHRLVATRPLRKYFLRVRVDAEPPSGQPACRRLGAEAATWCAAMVAEQWLDDGLCDGRKRALLGLLFSAWIRADGTAVGGLDPARRARLLQLVANDPARRWTRAELGAALGVSGLHLARQVRRTFGVPLRRWLVEVRIRAAAGELRDGSGRIGALAERYGYADLFLFSRQFRQVMGVPPRAWRAAP